MNHLTQNKTVKTKLIHRIWKNFTDREDQAKCVGDVVNEFYGMGYLYMTGTSEMEVFNT